MNIKISRLRRWIGVFITVIFLVTPWMVTASIFSDCLSPCCRTQPETGDFPIQSLQLKSDKICCAGSTYASCRMKNSFPVEFRFECRLPVAENERHPLIQGSVSFHNRFDFNRPSITFSLATRPPPVHPSLPLYLQTASLLI